MGKGPTQCLLTPPPRRKRWVSCNHQNRSAGWPLDGSCPKSQVPDLGQRIKFFYSSSFLAFFLTSSGSLILGNLPHFPIFRTLATAIISRLIQFRFWFRSIHNCPVHPPTDSRNKSLDSFRFIDFWWKLNTPATELLQKSTGFQFRWPFLFFFFLIFSCMERCGVNASVEIRNKWRTRSARIQWTGAHLIDFHPSNPSFSSQKKTHLFFTKWY